MVAQYEVQIAALSQMVQDKTEQSQVAKEVIDSLEHKLQEITQACNKNNKQLSFEQEKLQAELAKLKEKVAVSAK